MDRRKKLLNVKEKETSNILEKVVTQYGAKVYTKIRIADVLDISGSGISNDEYKYGLMAHFDFVISGADDVALFAVEFDGLLHQNDNTTRTRDAKKDAICTTLNFPLLRINSDFVNHKYRRFTLLGWLIELWFLEQEYNKLQEQGLIDFYDSFSFISIVGNVPDSDGTLKLNFPFVLSANAIGSIKKAFMSGECLDFLPTLMWLDDIGGYIVGIAVLRVSENKIISTYVRTRAFNFSPVSPWEMWTEIATVNIGDKFAAYRQGKLIPKPLGYVKRQIDQLHLLAKKQGKKVLRQGGVLDL